jgi:WD repeat-containing protein 23
MLMQSAQSGNGLPLHARRRVRTPSPIPEPDTEKGNEILNSGEFGRVDSAYIPSKDNRKNITRKLWMRELKPRTVNPLSIGEV